MLPLRKQIFIEELATAAEHELVQYHNIWAQLAAIHQRSKQGFLQCIFPSPGGTEVVLSVNQINHNP